MKNTFHFPSPATPGRSSQSTRIVRATSTSVPHFNNSRPSQQTNTPIQFYYVLLKQNNNQRKSQAVRRADYAFVQRPFQFQVSSNHSKTDLCFCSVWVPKGLGRTQILVTPCKPEINSYAEQELFVSSYFGLNPSSKMATFHILEGKVTA